MTDIASPLAGTTHREMAAALASEDPDLRWLHGLWTIYNGEHYTSAMVQPYILLDEPSEPRRYGQFSARGGLVRQAQIMIRPSLLDGTHPKWCAGAALEHRRRFVADVLLHESIHQWQHEVAGQPDESYHGHGPAFRDKANEIGARYGLPPVRVAKKRGRDADLPSCAQWPHCVRPADYYGGHWDQPGTTTVCPVAVLRSALGATLAAVEAVAEAGLAIPPDVLAVADEVLTQMSQLAETSNRDAA